jgi:hypothetical protein
MFLHRQQVFQTGTGQVFGVGHAGLRQSESQGDEA